MHVLVTGGLGYIGAHVVDALIESGHEVDVVDCSTSLENFDFVQTRCNNLWNGEVQDLRNQVGWKQHYDGIVHLASLISVEQSVREPNTYWRNNLTALMDLCFLETDHLIFASTGAAFKPTNPYAWTKVAGERYIQDLHGSQQAWFKGHTIFRFYNVGGLKKGIHPTGRPRDIVRVAAEVARGFRPELKVFGNDYMTRDGTAVRDYIHVEDIAASVVNAIEAGPANTPFECLGTGYGSSVLEVVQSMQEVAGIALRVTMAPRRAGDDAVTVCPTQYKYIRISKTLHDMCLSAYENV